MSILDDITEFEKLWEKIKGHLIATEFKTPTTPPFKQPPEGTRVQDSSKDTVLFSFPKEYQDMIKNIHANTNISIEKFRKLVDEERAKAAGLLTEEAAIYLAASNLGLEIDNYKLKKKDEPKSFDYGAPTVEDLERAQVDMSVIDYLDLGKKLKPKKWLGDAFQGYNDTLKSFNYKYDGAEKAWLFQRSDETARTSQPKKATGTTGKAPKITRISDITDQRSVNIEGELQFDPEQRDVNTKQGPSTVTDFKINDGSATAKVTFWGDRGAPIMSFVKGDKLQVESLMVGEPYQEMPQLTAGRYTKVKQL